MQISYNTDEGDAKDGMSLIALLVRRYNLTVADIFPGAGEVSTVSIRVDASQAAQGLRDAIAEVSAEQPVADLAALVKSTIQKPVEKSPELDAAVAIIEQADNPATGAPDAAEVFATPARVMLPNANGHTYESLRDAGWTDAQMISAQMMEAPKVTAPLPPSSGAATAPPNTVPTPPPPPSDAASVFAASSATPAPPAANAAAPVDTTGVALDSDGLPWDGRIHASTRTKTAKGAWTKLKKVDPAVYEGVVAELRQAMAIDKAAAHVPLNGTAPPPPPANTAPPPPPPPPAATGPVTFADVMAYIGTRNFDEATIQRACVQHAVPGVSLLGIMPNKCADVLATLRAIP